MRRFAILSISLGVLLACGGLWGAGPPDWMGEDFTLPIQTVDGDIVTVGPDVGPRDVTRALQGWGWTRWHRSHDEGPVIAGKFERDGTWVVVRGNVVTRVELSPFEIPSWEPASILEDPRAAIQQAVACTRPGGGTVRFGVGSFRWDAIDGGWEIRDGNLLLTGRRPDGSDFNRTCRNVRAIGVTGIQVIACSDSVLAFCGVERGPVFEVKDAGGGPVATDMVARVLTAEEPGLEEEGGGFPFVYVGEPAKKNRSGVVFRVRDEDPLEVSWSERMAYRVRRDVGTADISIRNWPDAPVQHSVLVGEGTLPAP